MPLADLPSAIRSQLPAEAGTPDGDQSLVMVGNGGNSFWHALPDEYGGPDPIDRFTASVVSNTINEHFGNCEWHLLYPGTSPITLQQLGALAGWHNPSPLGLGINADFGLWYAYRAVITIDQRFEQPAQPVQPSSPCTTCIQKPCISQCPGKALSELDNPIMAACSNHRLKAESTCAQTCLARLACPVASEHRYDATQLRYHYQLSLETIRRYKRSDGS